MAGCLTEEQLARRILDQLKENGCPFVEGLYLNDAKTILEMLCTPSDYRLEILEWICSRIYPSSRQFLNTKESLDTRIKEMVKLGYCLTLCLADDVELIKGLASPQRQLTFMDQLLSVLKRDSISAGEQVRRTEEMLQDLCTSQHLQDFLNPELTPWPPDIKCFLARETPHFLAKEELLQKRGCTAEVVSEENNLQHILEALRKVDADIKKVREECVFLRDEKNSGDITCQTLRVAVSDLQHLILGFRQVFKSEFSEHCSRSTPLISNSGPLFQSIHHLLTSCSEELQAIAMVNQTSEKIVQVVTRQQQQQQSWGSNRMTTLPAKVEELRRRYEERQALYLKFKDRKLDQSHTM
ncbi:HAUS augmin-like complex subunit 7 [Protopterus annectens]|uniref:HAUS augmin-like complex subunit 7 n=1 Tax=Protopterus annectens TaxID=7888 RepID=UPI001CFC0D9D|nr:HAUS augmin-like complex subunit 7 [Protopterus annectens]